MKQKKQRIVVKVGTSTLTHESGDLDLRSMERLVRTLSDLAGCGHEVILVSSGAIGMGVGKLGLRERPKDIPSKQAAAAVGQCELMYIYDKLFSEYHHTVAQLLILLSDIDGLYTADPHTHPDAVLLHKVTKVDDAIKELAGVSNSTQGTGGMVTKLHAAEICLSCGCDMVIANGKNPDNLYAILDGQEVGTKFTEERV